MAIKTIVFSTIHVFFQTVTCGLKHAHNFKSLDNLFTITQGFMKYI